MSWKKWKRGLIIATLTGAATGICGILIGVTWQQAVVLMLGSIGKDALLYLRQNPIDNVQDTAFFQKPNGPTNPS